MNSISKLDHESEFQRAWADPSNTRFELPPVDVNQVLAKHYRTSEPLTFTRTMLWGMEVRKAWRPDRYIPSVVWEGSAHAWGQISAAVFTPVKLGHYFGTNEGRRRWPGSVTLTKIS